MRLRANILYMFRKNFITFLFLIPILAPYAQQIEIAGRVVDNGNNPIEKVKITCKDCQDTLVYSNAFGEYSVIAQQNQSVILKFEFDNLIEERTINTPEKRNYRLTNLRFDFIQTEVVDVNTRRYDPFEINPLPPIDLRQLPGTGGIGQFLALTTVATSNNELTSNYNVRGGNYDENLVYVEGFQINRPFLTRSGQQEGLSFINSSMVSGIRFSGGGFDASYGDKLSSVLDISYRKPRKFQGSLNASLLGVEAHVEGVTKSRFDYIVGVRYRANGYLLNSLPTKGAYNPVFYDGQGLINYQINEKLKWSTIAHFSSNNYRFAPQTQQTDFGTANEAYRFNVYFEGQENTRFQTSTVGTALKYTPNKKLSLDFYTSVFQTDEREYFDILGQYFINELETDQSKENFGDSIAVLGIGSFLNHARNRLQAVIFNTYFNGKYVITDKKLNADRTKVQSHELLFGLQYQRDEINDQLSEWKYLDSAGYSLPQNGNPDKVELYETIKSKLNLQNNKYSGFTQLNSTWSKGKKEYVAKIKRVTFVDGKKQKDYLYDTIPISFSRIALSSGLRAGYTDYNNEFYLTPRISVTFFPRKYLLEDTLVKRRDVRFRIATGLYYQPPIYREFRTFEGQLNPNVQSQKSYHFVTGMDYYFNMLNRDDPFKFSAETFYKYLWDVNPYEIENVRTRYFANNDATAYAVGMDFNLHGQFVKGVESFFKLGFLSTKEDIKGDFYYNYFNAAGEKIIANFSADQVVVDSVRVNPKFIPRPTDQLVNVGVLFQDRMPNYESFSAQLALIYNSGLPFGPPDRNRYKDTLRQRAYFRVDLGLSYDFLYKSQNNLKQISKFGKHFTNAVVSFEVFNLLGINNILSKQWIQDVQGKYYAIPNYLTQRRFNLKFILQF